MHSCIYFFKDIYLQKKKTLTYDFYLLQISYNITFYLKEIHSIEIKQLNAEIVMIFNVIIYRRKREFLTNSQHHSTGPSRNVGKRIM